MPLSPAAITILLRAADRPDHRLEFHRWLPSAARRKMIEAFVREGLAIDDADAPDVSDDRDTDLALTTQVLTNAGFHAVGREPLAGAAATAGHKAAQAPTKATGEDHTREGADAAQPPHSGLLGQPRTTLRQAAAALLAARDESHAEPATLAPAIDRLRIVLAGIPSRTPRGPRPPRAGTKQQAVLTLLRRPEGATIAQIVIATAWAQHTVRGFLANLKRKGVAVEVLERVRQAGPGTTGAKGSYTIYRITEAR